MIGYAIVTLADLMCRVPCPWQWSEDARLNFAWIVSVELMFEIAVCVPTAALWRIKHAKEKEANDANS